jgi:hypothetical protein
MPGHVISDAHEWINEIPTVPTYWWHPRSRRGRWFAEIVSVYPAQTSPWCHRVYGQS